MLRFVMWYYTTILPFIQDVGWKKPLEARGKRRRPRRNNPAGAAGMSYVAYFTVSVAAEEITVTPLALVILQRY